MKVIFHRMGSGQAVDKMDNTLKERKEKIKVSSAEIVVHGTKGRPYYEVKYHDLSDGEEHIGYISFSLDFVFDWLEEYFEVVEEDKKQIK